MKIQLLERQGEYYRLLHTKRYAEDNKNDNLDNI